MDEIKINSVFMKETISKVLKKLLKKLGYNIDFQLNDLQAAYSDDSDDKVHIRLALNVEITGDELWRIIFG